MTSYILITIICLVTIWSISELDQNKTAQIGWYDVRRAAQKGDRTIQLPNLKFCDKPYQARFVASADRAEFQIRPAHSRKWMVTDAIYEHVDKIDDELLTWIREIHESMAE